MTTSASILEKAQHIAFGVVDLIIKAERQAQLPRTDAQAR